MGVPYTESSHYSIGGFPPSSWIGPHAVCPHTPPCPRAVCVLLGRGVPVLLLGPVSRGGPEVVCSGSPLCAPAARRWRDLLVGGTPSPFSPSSAARVRCGRPFRGDPRCRPSIVGLLRSKISWGSPLWFLESPSREVLSQVLLGASPCFLAAHRGRALLGEGSPSIFPPRQPLALGAHDCSGVSSPPSLCQMFPSPRSLSWEFRPPLLLLWPPMSCGPMVVLDRLRPRAGWASHRRRRCLFAVLTALTRVTFGCGFSRAGGVCRGVSCAAGSLCRIPFRILLRHRALSSRAVSTIVWALPGISGGG